MSKNKNELDALVRKNIVMVLREILSDAEYHLPLKPAFLKKVPLLKSIYYVKIF